jgi:hypothetical protein
MYASIIAMIAGISEFNKKAAPLEAACTITGTLINYMK